MRIFLAGATGAVGQLLVPALVEAGHTVVGTTRNPAKADTLRAAGAEPAVVDGLDADGVLRAVATAKPDVVVHQLTGLSGPFEFKHLDKMFAETNRLRTEGVDHLLAAARASGAQRFVAQSYAGWSLGTDVPAAARETIAAIGYVGEAVAATTDLAGIVLRYGTFYGPGTGLGNGGHMVEMIRSGQLPLVGDGGGVWSFVHMADLVTATVAAIEGRGHGTYDVVDDEPAAVRDWLPYLADTIGGEPPTSITAEQAEPVIGDTGVAIMTRSTGGSNERTKRDLGWSLVHPSWREGFRTGL